MPHYVYRFLNADEVTIYFGRTGDLQKRLCHAHFTRHGHLRPLCYVETREVQFAQCASWEDADMKETYFINTLAPHYNKKKNNGSKFQGIFIEDLAWESFPFRPWDDKRRRRKPLPLVVPTSVELPLTPVAVRGLPPEQHLWFTKVDPGTVSTLPLAITPYNPLRGIIINGELWLTDVSVAKFCMALADDLTKLRAMQFIQRGYLEAKDFCLIANQDFIERTHACPFGIHPAGPRNQQSHTVLLRADSLAGYIEGLFERTTRSVRRRLDANKPVKRIRWHGDPASEFRYYRDFDDYLVHQMGPAAARPCIQSFYYHSDEICGAVRRASNDWLSGNYSPPLFD